MRKLYSLMPALLFAFGLARANQVPATPATPPFAEDAVAEAAAPGGVDAAAEAADADGLDIGSTPCGTAVCGPREFCCNASCSTCAPIGGGCTQQVCDVLQ